MHCFRPTAKIVTAALVATASLIAPLAGVAADTVPGVTDTSILLGGSHPFSGPASAYAVIDKGIQAYFAYQNDRGGVNGRKITYKDLDDGYNPQQALSVTKQLVEQDRVFAIFNSLGTPVNLALRPYLNDQKVPQLFVASGATAWGTDAAKYPWTIGYQPDYQAEAIVFGKYIAAHEPSAKIAVLYQNDDFGQDYLTGLQKGLGNKSGQIVKSATYEVTDPDVRSQIAALQASGADTLLVAATPKFATGAMTTIGQLGWKVHCYLTDVSASQTYMRAATQAGGPGATNGVVSAIYNLDPTNPKMADLAGMKLYHQILSKYAPDVDASSVFVVYGMAVAYTMIDTLQKAGKYLTRDKVMDAAIHLDETNNPFLIAGISVKTSPSDRFPIRQEGLIRYENGSWVELGAVIDARR